jgi:hypothetical protein
VKIGANRNHTRFLEANVAELRGLYQRGHFLSSSSAAWRDRGQRSGFLAAAIVA